MQTPLQTRVSVVLLAVFTLTAAVFASLNFLQEGRDQQPTDGAVWYEVSGGLKAERVPAGSPAERAGVRAGDLMIAVNDRPTPREASLEREMFRTKVYGSATYSILRSGVRVEIPVILDAPDHSQHQGQRIIALIYLGIDTCVKTNRRLVNIEDRLDRLEAGGK